VKKSFAFHVTTIFFYNVNMVKKMFTFSHNITLKLNFIRISHLHLRTPCVPLNSGISIKILCNSFFSHNGYASNCLIFLQDYILLRFNSMWVIIMYMPNKLYGISYLIVRNAYIHINLSKKLTFHSFFLKVTLKFLEMFYSTFSLILSKVSTNFGL